jgi:hypothetical protein
VLRSVEDPNGVACVDILRCPDGRFGFAHCRRDPEDGRGWVVLEEGAPGGYDSAGAAFEAALAAVAWLRETDA